MNQREFVFVRLSPRLGLNSWQIIWAYMYVVAKAGFAAFSANGPFWGIGKRRQKEVRARLAQGDTIEVLFVIDRTVVFSAEITDFASGRVPVTSPWGGAMVPTVFGGGGELNRTWFRLTNIGFWQGPGTSKMFFSGKSGKSLEDVLERSQCSWGYIHF